MTGSQTVLDAVVDSIERTGRYNRNDQTQPAAILWPDRDRVWEPLLPRLRGRLPLLTLGAYDPASHTGPSYWIRCVIAGTLDDQRLDGDGVPVIYLPGIARTDIRAIEDCPREIQPLADLQYRGVLWTHKNGRDWTVAGFLQATDGGLGIEVGGDNATREALSHALVRLADVPIEDLSRDAPLRADFFHHLLLPDEARNLLLWLDDPDAFVGGTSAETRASFRALCRQKYRFDPDRDGPISAAGLLGSREGHWEAVWRRYAESPASYPSIPQLLRQGRPDRKTGQLSIFFHRECWPQENESDEQELRTALLALRDGTPNAARETLRELERRHGVRRDWVWRQLGVSPLAVALEHLAALADATSRALGGATVNAMADAYADWGWRADDAVTRALAEVTSHANVEAVSCAIDAVYRDWLEGAAIEFQATAGNDSVARSFARDALPTMTDGTCLVFTDALRLDVAHRLMERLGAVGLGVTIGWRLAALPTVTPTAKPAVTPARNRIGPSSGFDTIPAGSASKTTAESLRKAIASEGVQVLRGIETGDPSGTAWTEVGEIDALGHERGLGLCRLLPGAVEAIAERIQMLVDAGWQHVMLVTDHGWLLSTGELPKAHLPEHLTETRKGRCARLKPNSDTDQQTVPWFWDDEVRVAVARGISCYEAGKVYEHGGLSPQECVIPVVTISARTETTSHSVTIDTVNWRGLRCSMTLSGTNEGMLVDLRRKAGDPASSIITAPVSPSVDGRASMLVVDDDLEGQGAFCVVLSSAGSIAAQQLVTIGE